MPHRPPTPCPDCGTLTTTRRCPDCQHHHDRQRAKQRPTTRQAFGPRWNATSRAIITRDDGICWICGQPGADTADHITPRSAGGTHHPDNLAAAHRTCNSRRGTKPIVRPS